MPAVLKSCTRTVLALPLPIFPEKMSSWSVVSGYESVDGDDVELRPLFDRARSIRFFRRKKISIGNRRREGREK